MSAKIFNPAEFAPTSNEESQEKDQTRTEEPKNYAVTGNSTRDSVRKLLYEIFIADDANIQQVAATIEEIENQISKDCPDSKSRQYRDMSRLVQTKLKGQRFQDIRNGLINGNISVSEVCSDDFLSGKKQLASKPASGPRSGLTNVNAIKPNFPKGAPGQAVRPRGMPTGQVFRPPGMRAPAPQRMPLVQQFQHVQNQQSEDQPSPSELKIEKRASTLSQKSLVEQFEEQSKPIEDNQVAYPDQMDQSQHKQTPQRIQEDISQQIEVPPSFVQEESKEEVTMQINTPHFQNQDVKNDHIQSFDASYEVSADHSTSYDALKPPSGKNKNFPDQVFESDENTIAVKKGVKAKKKKKKKVDHDNDQMRTISNLDKVVEVQTEIIDHQPVFEQAFAEEVKQPVEEQFVDSKFHQNQYDQVVLPSNFEAEKTFQTKQFSKEEQKLNESFPKVTPNLEQERQMTPPKQNIRELPQIQPSSVQPVEIQIPKIQQRVQNVFLPSQTSNDQRMDQILAENQRLRQQIRQQASNEDQNLNLQHQIQLLQGQLKNREEQVSVLRWQLQQQQIQHQTQIDELRSRLSSVQQESQHFREQFVENRRQVLLVQQTGISEIQREQTLARNQQQSVQHLQIRSEEMTADRGSNFLGNSFQHAGNQVIGGDINDNNFESGEADEGGRDDGHFYRNTTADEGTGGAGESYQQRIIDGVSSGSGQMPINSVSGYQRYEQVYGTGEDVQEIQNEDEEEDDETYQTQYFGQNENNIQQNSVSQQQRVHHTKQSSSGSAFGEGNQQDDSEEGMGMGMGNRQGSGHDVEDESGSLDVVAQNSSQHIKIQQIFSQTYHQQQQRHQINNDKTNNTTANNQGDSFEPHQQEIAEIDEDQNISLGEEGGRSEGREDLNDALYNQLREFNQIESEFQDQQFNEILPQHEINSQKNYDEHDEESTSNQGSEEDSQQFENNQKIGQNKLVKQTNLSLLNPGLFQQMDEEEEKGDFDQTRQSFSQKNQAVIGDNVERPQPYHPRQQQRNNQTPVNSSGAAAFININQGAHQLYQQYQNTQMQGESISGDYKQERVAAPKYQQSTKTSIGGVAVATRQRANIPLPQSSNKNSSIILNNQVQAGERPGPPQRRGNKQQFQVPPLPQSSSTTQSNSNTRGQGQGGGVVGQNQSSSLTRAAGRNSRGTQRNNPQQQFMITQVNQNQPLSSNQSEINLQSQSQTTKQPASQTSSAAQLPLFKQQVQSSIGGATGGIQNVRQQNATFLNEENQQTDPISRQNFGTGNNQTSGIQSFGAISQASTMPASQASASGSGNIRQQLHNGAQGQTDRLHNQQNQQMQSAVTINHTQRQEGVVHTPGSHQQHGTYQGQSQLGAGNTQALGGAMMGSSGSIIGGDIGGLTERTTRGNNGVTQMNAESGSTTEFTSQRNNHSTFLGSNALLTTQAYQQVSSPPSNQTQVRNHQSQNFNNYQQQQNSQQSIQQEIEGHPTSGGGDTEFFQAAVLAPPQTYSTRGAISSAQPGVLQFQNQQARKQNHVNTQQQSLFQGGNIQKGSGSGEAEQSYHHINHQTQGVVSMNGNQTMHEQSFVQQYAHHNEDDRANTNLFERARRPPVLNRNINDQIQQEWARTDSKKTSGANTPSKDGADTPPYRDQVQNNSLVNPHILNLTSRRLQNLQNRSNLSNEIVHQPQRTNEPNNARLSLEQQEEHEVIPKTMFE